MSSDIELNTNIVDGTDGADTMKWGEQSPTAVDLEQAHLLDVNAPSSSSNDRDGVTKGSMRERALYWIRQIFGFLLANWYKFVILGIVITLIVLVSIHGFSVFGSILAWFKHRNGWGGWGAYVGFYTGIVALYFPGIVFIMGAGFVFGFWRGLLAVWIGGAVGQALAFLLARYLLRDWVESFVQHKWKKWKYIDAAIENDGWKLVLIMRMSPIIPYNLLNIAMATTSMHFAPFALVSAIGIVFECAIFVYLGTMADSITSIVAGETKKTEAVQWVLLGLSITMGVLGAIFVSVMIRRAIKKAEMMAVGDSDSGDDEARQAGVTVCRLDTLDPERPPHKSADSLNEYSSSSSLLPANSENLGFSAFSTPSKQKSKLKTSPRGDPSIPSESGILDGGTPFVMRTSSRRRSHKNDSDDDL